LFQRVPKNRDVETLIATRTAESLKGFTRLKQDTICNSGLLSPKYRHMIQQSGLLEFCHVYDSNLATIDRSSSLNRSDDENIPILPINGDVLMSFTICHPDNLHCQQTITVLGSQSLWELQSAICCVNSANNKYTQNSSEDKDFFFIEGVFYVDLGENVSETIVDISQFPNNIKRICQWLGKSEEPANQATAATARAVTEKTARRDLENDRFIYRPCTKCSQPSRLNDGPNNWLYSA
jgi:hypothetical protein